MARHRSSGNNSADVGLANQVDDLFRASLADFTAARNALASKLKKGGHAEDAAGVKATQKPSLSAWAANQLYWRHRDAFDRLIGAGDLFRQAQAAQLAGKTADLRNPLDARRQAMTELSKLATAILHEAGHSSPPDTMRRVMTTLEALAAYGSHPGAPPAGRLTTDVDPPGFEALASLVPQIGTSRPSDAPSRVIQFTQRTTPPTRKKAAASPGTKEHEAERRKAEATARKVLKDAEHALEMARRAAARAELSMKAAATEARSKDDARTALEARLEKAGAEADAARKHARVIASQAEEATQALDDAERTVARARETLKKL